MDTKYYPKDGKKAKERELLSLKQGNMSVMEYAATFNELSRFGPESSGYRPGEDGSF